MRLDALFHGAKKGSRAKVEWVTTAEASRKMSLDRARSGIATATGDTDRNTGNPQHAAAAATMLNGSEESDATSVTSTPDPSTALWPHSDGAGDESLGGGGRPALQPRAPATFPFNHRRDRVHHSGRDVIKGPRNKMDFAENEPQGGRESRGKAHFDENASLERRDRSQSQR